MDLLRAKCAFIGGDLGIGRSYVSSALRHLENADDSVPQAEIRLRQAQSHMVCASMHVAIGRKEDAYACMETVLAILNKMPRTAAVSQLSRELETLAMLIVQEEEEPLVNDFNKYMAGVRERWTESQQIEENQQPHLAEVAEPESKVVQASTVE